MDIFKKNSLELILRFGDSDTNITYPYPCNIVHFYRWQLYFWSIVIACQFLPRILIFAKLIVVYFCFLAEDGSRLWLALAEVKQNNNRNRMLVNLATFLLQKPQIIGKNKLGTNKSQQVWNVLGLRKKF